MQEATIHQESEETGWFQIRYMTRHIKAIEIIKRKVV